VKVSEEHPHEGGHEAEVAGSAVLPVLDGPELSGLRAAGIQWQDSAGSRAAGERALPVDPRLSYESDPGARRGRFVQIRSGRPEHSEDLEAMPLAGAIPSGSGRFGFVTRRVIFGPALRSAALAEERMRKLVALPVLSGSSAFHVGWGPGLSLPATR
jgi:hypothetical protein